MTVVVTNAQRAVPVQMRQMRQLARCALRRLQIRTAGQWAITFIDSRRMRAFNKQFLRHDRPTDVLSFRYDGEPIVGEVLIDPRQALTYAKAHGLPYHEELKRYIVHGLLHWLGHEDRTAAQQQKMRRLEDGVLKGCGRA